MSKFNLDELCRLRSDLKTGDVVGSTLRYQYQIDRYIKALDDVIGSDMSPQGEWISVKDKLPHKEGRCLVFTDYGDVTMDSFVDGMFVCNLGNVTHWRPLPPKPYESEAEE